MAAMTIAPVIGGQTVTADGKRAFKAVCTFGTTYATGGDTVPMASIPFKQVDRIEMDLSGNVAASVMRTFVPDLTSSVAPKIKLYTAASTEATNATDQSTVIVTLTFVGK